jgi:hypothetical protein
MKDDKPARGKAYCAVREPALAGLPEIHRLQFRKREL